ncbi:lymphocyte antigen 6K isoform X1 [Vicugna pacos]|uniref:Lymphocyte antigen 6K isoform X1 n=1 Tax=Vicugna pacos TaxID=30538 RepID=A0ABM5CBC5_VICPA
METDEFMTTMQLLLFCLQYLEPKFYQGIFILCYQIPRQCNPAIWMSCPFLQLRHPYNAGPFREAPLENGAAPRPGRTFRKPREACRETPVRPAAERTGPGARPASPRPPAAPRATPAVRALEVVSAEGHKARGGGPGRAGGRRKGPSGKRLWRTGPPRDQAEPSGSRAKPVGRRPSDPRLRERGLEPARPPVAHLRLPAPHRLCGPLRSCPRKDQASLEMTVLLALLLVMGMPWVETNITVSGRQRRLRCHVCEIENSFNCQHPMDCDRGVEYCSTAAVRVFPRFFYVSKQCMKYCALSFPGMRTAKSFVLVKPTPFLFISCCRENLCNVEKPVIEENSEDKYREVGGAPGGRGSSPRLVTLVALVSALLGLRLP